MFSSITRFEARRRWVNKFPMRPTEAKTVMGKTFVVLLPSVKMKSLSTRGTTFEREFHHFLMDHFGGYTVASGSITGYWKNDEGREECNEHRRYEVALAKRTDATLLEKQLAGLALELGEKSIFCQTEEHALVIRAREKAR